MYRGVGCESKPSIGLSELPLYGRCRVILRHFNGGGQHAASNQSLPRASKQPINPPGKQATIQKATPVLTHGVPIFAHIHWPPLLVVEAVLLIAHQQLERLPGNSGVVAARPAAPGAPRRCLGFDENGLRRQQAHRGFRPTLHKQLTRAHDHRARSAYPPCSPPMPRVEIVPQQP